MFILQCFLNIPGFDKLPTSLLFANYHCKEGYMFLFLPTQKHVLSFLCLLLGEQIAFFILCIYSYFSLCVHTHARRRAQYKPVSSLLPSHIWSREIFNLLIKGLDRVCRSCLYSKAKYRMKGGQDVSN